MRLIIHFENCDDKLMALIRVYKALPEYYRLKGEDDRRLTIRFDAQGAMIIYHDREDIVVFTQK